MRDSSDKKSSCAVGSADDTDVPVRFVQFCARCYAQQFVLAAPEGHAARQYLEWDAPDKALGLNGQQLPQHAFCHRPGQGHPVSHTEGS